MQSVGCGFLAVERVLKTDAEKSVRLYKNGVVLETFFQFMQMLFHLDRLLGSMVEQYGFWVYALLFAVIFCETGLVILPFLPGDSLLFVSGAFCAGHALSLFTLVLLLPVAAILGNAVNYQIGGAVGPRVFEMQWRWLDKQALLKTRVFYERHGGKTIILARFLPVIRTFAPFVAGVCGMRAGKFHLFNLMSALLWVLSLVLAGYFFGNLPFIKRYLNWIVLAGIAAALVPVVIHAVWQLIRKKQREV